MKVIAQIEEEERLRDPARRQYKWVEDVLRGLLRMRSISEITAAADLLRKVLFDPDYILLVLETIHDSIIIQVLRCDDAVLSFIANKNVIPGDISFWIKRRQLDFLADIIFTLIS
jgi:hypothetical protein